MSKYPEEGQRDCVIVDALIRKKKGEDPLPVLVALSEVLRDQRQGVESF